MQSIETDYCGGVTSTNIYTDVQFVSLPRAIKSEDGIIA